MSPPTLHFFCGKAGAGKSTLASRLAQDHQALSISEDVWLSRLYGDEMKTFEDFIRCSRRLKTVIGPLVVDLLKAGQSVVLDFQANTRAGRQWFRSVFEQAGAAHVLHVLEATDSQCLERIARRNRALPEGAHPLSEQDFLHISSFFQAPEADEGFTLSTHGS